MARILGSDTVLPDLPPQPKLHQFPTKKLTRDTLPAFNAMGQNIVANNVRPSPTIVNQPSMNLSHLSRFRAEDMIPNMSVHGVHENFGGDPRSETNHASISRPTNPRTMFNAPSVTIAPSVNRMSLREAPVLPRANLPKQVNIGKLIPPSNGMRMEAEYVAPPVNLGDFRGLAPNRNRQFGVNAGRTFGAEGHLL
jgi:hypothetical protein